MNFPLRFSPLALVLLAAPATAQVDSNNIVMNNGGDVLFIFSSPSPGTTWIFCDSTNDIYWKTYAHDASMNFPGGLVEIDSFQESLFDTDWTSTPAFYTRSLGLAIPDASCGETLEPAFFQLGFTTETCVAVGPSGFGNPCTVAPSLCSPTTGSCPPPGYVNGYLVQLNFGSTPGTGVIVTADGTPGSDLSLTYFVDGGMSVSSGTGACGLGNYTIQDVHSWDETQADQNTCAPGTSRFGGFQTAGSGPIPDAVTSVAEASLGFRCGMTLQTVVDNGAGGGFETGPGGCGGALNGLRVDTSSGGVRLSFETLNAADTGQFYFVGASVVGLFPSPGVFVLGDFLLIIPHGLTSAVAAAFSGIPATPLACVFPEVGVQYHAAGIGIPVPPLPFKVCMWSQSIALDFGPPPSASFSGVSCIWLY